MWLVFLSFHHVFLRVILKSNVSFFLVCIVLVRNLCYYFWDCHDKLSQIWWVKTIEIYSVHLLKTEVPNQDLRKVRSFWML